MFAGYGTTFCKILNCTTRKRLEEECDTGCMQDKPLPAIAEAWNKAGNNIPDIVFDNWEHWLDAFLDFTPTVDGDWVVENPQV